MVADARGALRLAGRVDADGMQDAAVLAPVAARVVAVRLAPGTRVRRGDAIVDLGGPAVAESSHGLRAVEAALQQARAQRDRDARLFADGIVARTRVERSQAEFVRAEAEWEHARHVAEAGTLAHGLLIVRAPRDGVLQGPMLSIGEALDAGAVVARIGSGDGRRVLLNAPPGVARQLAAGDLVRVASRDCSAVGTVTSVGTSVEPATQSVAVTSLVAGEPCLLTGEAVTASVTPRRFAADGYAVPAAAFVRHAGAVYVFVDGTSGVEPVAVDADAAGAGIARSPRLLPHSRVVVRGTAALKSAWLAQSAD